MHNYFRRSLSAAWYLLGQLLGYGAASLWEIDHRWSRRSQSAPILQIQKLTRQSKWLGQSRKSACKTWRRRKKVYRLLLCTAAHQSLASALCKCTRACLRTPGWWFEDWRPPHGALIIGRGISSHCAPRGELQNKIRNRSSSSGRSERRRVYQTSVYPMYNLVGIIEINQLDFQCKNRRRRWQHARSNPYHIHLFGIQYLIEPLRSLSREGRIIISKGKEEERRRDERRRSGGAERGSEGSTLLSYECWSWLLEHMQHMHVVVAEVKEEWWSIFECNWNRDMIIDNR